MSVLNITLTQIGTTFVGLCGSGEMDAVTKALTAKFELVGGDTVTSLRLAVPHSVTFSPNDTDISRIIELIAGSCEVNVGGSVYKCIPTRLVIQVPIADETSILFGQFINLKAVEF